MQNEDEQNIKILLYLGRFSPNILQSGLVLNRRWVSTFQVLRKLKQTCRVFVGVERRDPQVGAPLAPWKIQTAGAQYFLICSEVWYMGPVMHPQQRNYWQCWKSEWSAWNPALGPFMMPIQMERLLYARVLHLFPVVSVHGPLSSLVFMHACPNRKVWLGTLFVISIPHLFHF